nr:hypothetical protein [Cryobacterium sp. Y62]
MAERYGRHDHCAAGVNQARRYTLTAAGQHFVREASTQLGPLLAAALFPPVAALDIGRRATVTGIALTGIAVTGVAAARIGRAHPQCA